MITQLSLLLRRPTTGLRLPLCARAGLGPQPQPQPQPQLQLHTSAAALSAPRSKPFAQHGSGGKLKSHTGTKKRWSPLGSGSGKAYQTVFKRAYAGKAHLNSHMSSTRINSLGRTALSPRGKIGRTLRRLLGPAL